MKDHRPGAKDAQRGAIPLPGPPTNQPTNMAYRITQRGSYHCYFGYGHRQTLGNTELLMHFQEQGKENRYELTMGEFAEMIRSIARWAVVREELAALGVTVEPRKTA